MAGFVASGATFTFCGVKATVTRVSVETPTAEIVDMTPSSWPTGQPPVLVPTGALTGGSIDVDFIASPGGVNPESIIGKVGTAQFSSPSLAVSQRAVCESASREAAVGDIVRGSMTLRFTGYTAQTDSVGGNF